MLTMISSLIFAVSIISTHAVIVQTPLGEIRGFQSNDVDIYLGIRYGQFPVRWTLASFPTPWNGTFNATSYGPICHQFGPYNQPSLYNETEQCLFLNIWVPKSKKSNILLPVRIWIHGGGYTAGSSNDYDAANLSRLSNSIIVTINYRLGIFGFFPLPNVDTRNFGWLDQQLAFRWVQKNIPAFGGDKTNVMLFGQSAGGGSTVAHLLIPTSWSLYSSIIAQSAGPFRYANCEEMEAINWKSLQTSFPACQADLACYRHLNASQLYENSTLNWVTLWPCIGARSQLSSQPITLIRQGQFNRQASILAGMNSNEGQTTILTFNHFQTFLNASQYHQLALDYLIPEALIELYDPTTTDKDYFSALTWLFNDYHIQCPSLFLFARLSNWSIPVYTYFFVHPTETWAFSPFHFNATHLTEIPYVFQNDFALTQLTSLERNLSSTLIELFTEFHQHRQPWTSFLLNQTVLLFNLTADGTMNTQSGFGQRLIDKCPIIEKYVDPTFQ